MQSTLNRPLVPRAGSWVVLPFRPEYQRGLGRLIHEVNSEFSLYERFLFSRDPDLNILDCHGGDSTSSNPIVGVSWTLDAPNLLRRFATSNKYMHRDNPETFSIFTQELAEHRAACVLPFV